MQSEAGRFQPRQCGSHHLGILGCGIRDKTNLAIDLFRCPREAAERGLVIGYSHEPFDTVS
jgi:hypothetical protein